MTDLPVRVEEHVDPPSAHEESDVDTRGLQTFLFYMVAFIAVTSVIVYGQYRWFEARARANDPKPLPRADERRPAPKPHLQVDEPGDMQALRTRQREMIDQYAWVDQNEKRVRIPVSRAMEEIAKNGIRRWPAPPEATEKNDPEKKDDAKPTPPADAKEEK
jgi:hypothetical protein